MIYHYYWFGDQAKTGENSNNVALHYFGNEDPGAFVSVSGGGVLASSKHPDAGAGLPEMDRRARAGRTSCGTATPSNMLSAMAPIPTRSWCRWRDLQAPKVEPSKLNSKKVTDLMTAAGLL